jgi:hypothetical protein
MIAGPGDETSVDAAVPPCTTGRSGTCPFGQVDQQVIEGTM